MATLFLQTTKFINSSPGLEKTLRLVQAICQIIASYSISPGAWGMAKKQVALGRRYLRIMRFVNAFEMSYAAMRENHGMKSWLLQAKWGFLGCYLGLESLTILDAMQVYPTTWARPVFMEAMRFWFLSISASVMLGVCELWTLTTATHTPTLKPVDEEMYSSSETREGRDRKEKRYNDRVKKAHKKAVLKTNTKGRIMKNLVSDLCDIFIPGTVTGWLVMSSANVGWCSVVSTLLAGSDVWVAVQAAP